MEVIAGCPSLAPGARAFPACTHARATRGPSRALFATVGRGRTPCKLIY